MKKQPTIINLVHIGDKVYNFDELSKEEKTRIATALNKQALMHLGYRPRETEKTAETR